MWEKDYENAWPITAFIVKSQDRGNGVISFQCPQKIRFKPIFWVFALLLDKFWVIRHCLSEKWVVTLEDEIGDGPLTCVCISLYRIILWNFYLLMRDKSYETNLSSTISSSICQGTDLSLALSLSLLFEIQYLFLFQF